MDSSCCCVTEEPEVPKEGWYVGARVLSEVRSGFNEVPESQALCKPARSGAGSPIWRQ